MRVKISLHSFLFISCFFAFLMSSANSFAADVCWKDTYGRGVGAVPGECSLEDTKSGLLCYPKCKAGFSVVAGVCWQQCPTGWRDDGAFCKKPAGYSRGSLWFSMTNCQKANKEHGCEKSWGAIYPRCKPGFVAHVATECSPACPASMKDIGISCQKTSYVVRPITPSCGSQQYDAGLCYKKCTDKFNGIGPVCWGLCPPELPIDCGAMCGATALDCATSIGEQILAVGSVIGKIAAAIGTLGGSAAGTVAAEAGRQSAATAIKEAAKKVAKDIAKKLAGAAKGQIKARIAQELKNIPGMPPAMADKLSDMGADADNFDYKEFLMGLDPTGISQVVDAFNKKICGR